jgi:predicted transcriptional regulator
VEILTTNLLVLHTLGHRLRTTEARALRDEGLSCRDIAELFGVSRQRVMALLRTPPAGNGHDKSPFRGAEDRQPANTVAAAP